MDASAANCWRLSAAAQFDFIAPARKVLLLNVWTQKKRAT
jgi:hypothetical protein